MLHAFSTCMGSLLGTKYALKLIKRMQKLVTGIRASHRPKALLEAQAKAMGIKRMLITSNKTRFTSVHASIESVLRLKEPLQQVARLHPDCLSDKLKKYVLDDFFFLMIKQLCTILEPFTLVIQAVQADCATLADMYGSNLQRALLPCLQPAARRGVSPSVQVGRCSKTPLPAAQSCGMRFLWKLAKSGSVVAKAPSNASSSCPQTCTGV